MRETIFTAIRNNQAQQEQQVTQRWSDYSRRIGTIANGNYYYQFRVSDNVPNLLRFDTSNFITGSSETRIGENTMDLVIGVTYNFQQTFGYGALSSNQFQATVVDRKIAGVHNGQQTYVYRIVVRNQEGLEIWIPQNYLSTSQIRAWQ